MPIQSFAMDKGDGKRQEKKDIVLNVDTHEDQQLKRAFSKIEWYFERITGNHQGARAEARQTSSCQCTLIVFATIAWIIFITKQLGYNL